MLPTIKDATDRLWILNLRRSNARINRQTILPYFTRNEQSDWLSASVLILYKKGLGPSVYQAEITDLAKSYVFSGKEPSEKKSVGSFNSANCLGTLSRLFF
jgi:hypothetical protein